MTAVEPKSVIVSEVKDPSISSTVKWIMALIICLSIGGNVLFLVSYFKGKELIKQYEDQISLLKKNNDDQQEVIKALDGKLNILNARLDDIDKKKKDQEQKKKQDIQHYSKPLPVPEEDKLFADNRIDSKRTDKNGRYLTNEGVIQVQLIIAERDNLKAELCIANETIAVKDSMIDVYKQQLAAKDKIIENDRQIDEQRQKEIKKYKADAASQKVWKWVAIIGGGIVAGAAMAN